MGKTLVPDIPVRARVGCTEVERRSPQLVRVDLEAWWDVRSAGEADDLSEAVDYVALRDEVERVAAARPYALIEAIAEGVATALLERFPLHRVLVRVRKPSALAQFGIPWAGVEIVRERGG